MGQRQMHGDCEPELRSLRGRMRPSLRLLAPRDSCHDLLVKIPTTVVMLRTLAVRGRR
jgi:hypothetical protein